MSPGSIPPALSLSRPLFSVAWAHLITAMRAAAAQVRRHRQRAAQRRLERQQWQTVRHLRPHLLRDIGAEHLQSWADAEHARDEWKARASMSGLG